MYCHAAVQKAGHACLHKIGVYSSAEAATGLLTYRPLRKSLDRTQSDLAN